MKELNLGLLGLPLNITTDEVTASGETHQHHMEDNGNSEHHNESDCNEMYIDMKHVSGNDDYKGASQSVDVKQVKNNECQNFGNGKIPEKTVDHS